MTMELHCALKAAGHLFQNKVCFHHNANDRFGFNMATAPRVKSDFESSNLTKPWSSDAERLPSAVEGACTPGPTTSAMHPEGLPHQHARATPQGLMWTFPFYPQVVPTYGSWTSQANKFESWVATLIASMCYYDNFLNNLSFVPFCTINVWKAD